MLDYFWVALGGALGSVLRYGVAMLSLRWGGNLPYGTLTVNVIGCLIIGMFLPAAFKIPLSMRLFIVTGFLGGLTTFSTFSFESWTFFQAGLYWQGFFNVFLTLALSLLATGLGYFVMTRFS